MLSRLPRLEPPSSIRRQRTRDRVTSRGERSAAGASELEALDLRGWVCLESLVPPEEVARLRVEVERLYALEGEGAGSEFKQEPGSRRLAAMPVARSRVAVSTSITSGWKVWMPWSPRSK